MDIQAGDSTIRSVWAACKIKDLLGQEKNNQLINQIITTSIHEKVLTEYTAILVLEPGFVIPDENDDEDNNEFPVLIPEIKDNVTGFDVFPNPITASSIVKYKIVSTSHVLLNLYDDKGQMVSTVVDENNSPGDYSVSLKAETLPSGIYICVLIIDGRIQGRIKVVVP